MILRSQAFGLFDFLFFFWGVGSVVGEELCFNSLQIYQSAAKRNKKEP